MWGFMGCGERVRAGRLRCQTGHAGDQGLPPQCSGRGGSRGCSGWRG